MYYFNCRILMTSYENNLLYTVQLYIILNVVCCVGRVEIQIEIQKGRCTANTDSMV